MVRICKHLFWTNFIVLSPHSKILWVFAASQADSDGLVQIHINVLPYLAGLTKDQGSEAIAELGKHNFYDDDQPPFLSKHETDDLCITKILPWKCRQCEVVARGFISLDVRQEVLSIGFCVHCGSDENLEVDHIRPVSLGGSSDRENLQALCRSCNRKKLNRFVG